MSSHTICDFTQVQISGDKCINTQLISGDIAIDGASIDDK